MPFLLCDRVQANGETYPAVHDYDVNWSEIVTLEQRNQSVVRCEYLPAFDSDPRISRITKARLAKYLPDDGEADESDAWVLKAVKRALLENWLAADDFGDANGLTVGDIPTAKRQRLIGKIDQLGLDRSGINLSTTIYDALRQLLPQISARIHQRAASPGGTFQDGFGGESSGTDLASHTPDTSGTAWTRQTGSLHDIDVGAAGIAYVTGAGNYTCDDQGSTEQYTQITVPAGMNSSTFALCRWSDGNNFWGFRNYNPSTAIQLYTKEAGSFNNRGSYSHTDVAGDKIKLEMTGNNGEVFLDTGGGFTSIIGPYNSSFNNTATGQGIGGSSATTGNFADYFEAGTLSSGTTPVTVTASMTLSPAVGTVSTNLIDVSASLTLTAAVVAASLYQRTIAATATLGASVAALTLAGVSVAATATMTAGISTATVYAQAVAATASFTASVIKTVKKSIAATFVAAPSILKKAYKSVAAAATFSAASNEAAITQQSASTTATFTAASSEVYIAKGSVKYRAWQRIYIAATRLLRL